MQRALGVVLIILALGACGGGGGAGAPDAGAAPDSPIGPTCGDNTCDSTESCADCPTDCGACPAGCGDGTCSAHETCQSCSLDCGACPAGCGDGVCAATETCTTCALDCSCPVAGAQLASGTGLVIQDISADGTSVAYTDAAGTLYAVSTAGGAPHTLSSAVDKARYKGGFLFAFHGLSATGKTAASMEIFAVGGTTAVRTDVQVKVKSTLGSADGAHYAYQRVNAAGTRDLVLDGAALITDEVSARALFTPSGGTLVVALWYVDPATGTQVQPVRAYPTAGGAPVTLVADGAGLGLALAPDGASAIVAANDNGTQATLTRVPLTGGAGTPLAIGDDTGFTAIPDGSGLVFLDAGAVRKVALDGSGLATLVASGAVAIDDVSASAIVYATAVDPTTLLETLRAVRISGTGDVALGAQAIDEGHPPAGALMAARDQVAGTAGSLELLPVASLTRTTFASMVTKSSFPDDARVVWLDAAGDLHVDPIAGPAAPPLQTRVGAFTLVPDSAITTTRGRVAYVLPTGVDAGLYLSPL